MGDKFHFKVYVFWRENEKPEVRRLILEKIFLSRFSHLNIMLQDVYPGLKTKTYSVAWKDEDGDEIIVSSDVEIMTAQEIWRGDVIKLFVYCKPEEAKDNIVKDGNGSSNKPADTLMIHSNVFCDVCGETIVGFRYKCGVCDNYDLCSRCEAAGHHPEHSMVRISTPRSAHVLHAQRTGGLGIHELHPLQEASRIHQLYALQAGELGIHELHALQAGSRIHQLHALHAGGIHQIHALHPTNTPRGTSSSSRSTSLEFRLGMPALGIQLAFNNNENRSIQ